MGLRFPGAHATWLPTAAPPGLNATGRRNLVVEALGVRAMPVPRRFDDRAQLLILWPPIQLALDLLRGGHQHRRVARAARAFLDRYRLAGHLLYGLNDLAYAVATAGADVVVQGFARLQMLQRQQMGQRQILD